ncbi:MAG TPA: sensor histidine kinase, partial [Prolixibacteraceae bacterium]|nr:sensor histidine kinase [Prolixibacteraceae bacterium]
VQNSISAESSRIELIVNEDPRRDLLTITITDNGKGMDEETRKQAADPFYTSRTTRKVGMGISLFRQSAEQSGGELTLRSKPGEGTMLEASFGFSNIDRPVMGDIAGTLTLLIGANPTIRFIYIHKTPLSEFEFDTDEVKQELDGVPIQHPGILKALKELIEENLEMIEANTG